MNNEKMLAAVLALPDADLMTASKIDDPIVAGTYYRADTVVRLLAEERERCAVTWEKLVAAARHGENIDDTLRRYGDVIRAGA